MNRCPECKELFEEAFPEQEECGRCWLASFEKKAENEAYLHDL